MAEKIGDLVESLALQLARFFDAHLITRVICGVLIIFVVGASFFTFYIQVSGDTSVLVKDVKGDVHIIIPRAPNAGVTSADIACKGKVAGPASARMNGYVATYAVRDKAGIVTTYSMVLTLDDRGEPRDAYSLLWETGDGVIDDRDQLTPIFIVTDVATTECL